MPFRVVFVGLFLIFCSSCVVTSGGGGRSSGADNIVGIPAFKLVSSKEDPDSRATFAPGNKSLQMYKNNPLGHQIERNYFHYTTTFNYKKSAVKQRAENDCWAACAKMLFSHEGANLAHPDYSKITQELDNAKDPKSAPEIFLTLLNESNKTTFQSPVSQAILWVSIMQNYPVIVGFKDKVTSRGHACVVTELYYYEAKLSLLQMWIKMDRTFVLDKVILVDPADGKRTEMSGAEFVEKADFAVSFVPKLPFATFMSWGQK